APAGGLGLPPVPQGQQMQYTVFVKGRLAAASEFENIIIREAGNGQVVRLRDVARVELAAADYSISGAEDDIPAALIGIFLQPDANALDVAKKIKQVMEEQAPRFPPGIIYSISYSTTPFVTEPLKELMETLLRAFVLAVFVPVAFLGGLTGQLYKQFALTLAVSVVLSAICALTFTPAMCALLLIPVEEAHPRHGPLGWFFSKFNGLFERSRNGYVRSVAVMERHAVIVMLTFGALLIAVWGLIVNRPTGLVPPEDQGYVLAVVGLPPAAALERTNAAMSALTHIAREVPGVDGVVYISGFNLLTGQAVSYNG